MRTRHTSAAFAFALLLLAAPADAESGSLRIESTWPSAAQIARVLMLRDHNTRVVIAGTALLGLACGTIGTFLLLRRRALMGDAISHATLPGIAAAFLVMTAAGGSGKYLPGLLLGALVSGGLGVAGVLLIRNLTRIREDAALGIVLSVFFGLGVALLGVIQKMERGSAAGLESFIYGKTASMLQSDALLIGACALVITLVCALLFKELTLLCFDQEFCAAQGRRVLLLDAVMMTLVIAVTVIGLQAVGLILIIAMLIIPPAAARFWTDRLAASVTLAAAFGALSGIVGAGLSALAPRLPAGAIIVLVATGLFVVSLVFGPARGVLSRLRDHLRLARTVARQNLLRTMYEAYERAPAGPHAGVSREELLARRSWSPPRLRAALRRAQRESLLWRNSQGAFELTVEGLIQARRTVRNHRLWELYLIHHADIAPSHVDRDADQLEHVLGARMVAELESLMAAAAPAAAVPPSPHDLPDPRR